MDELEEKEKERKEQEEEMLKREREMKTGKQKFASAIRKVRWGYKILGLPSIGMVSS